MGQIDSCQREGGRGLNERRSKGLATEHICTAHNTDISVGMA